jgi:hypothetical protein
MIDLLGNGKVYQEDVLSDIRNVTSKGYNDAKDYAKSVKDYKVPDGKGGTKPGSFLDKAQKVENDTLAKGANTAKEHNDWSKKYQTDNRSIVARAKNSVCQFPVYISQTIRVNEAQILSNMFERYYTTLVQAVIAQNPIITEDEANDLLFLKQFHTNLKESAHEIYSAYDNIVNKYYECIDDFDKTMKDSIFYTHHLTESCDVVFRVVPTTDENIIFESHRLANDPLTGFLYLSEADGDKTVETNSNSTTTNQFSSTRDYLDRNEILSICHDIYTGANTDDPKYQSNIIQLLKNDLQNHDERMKRAQEDYDDYIEDWNSNDHAEGEKPKELADFITDPKHKKIYKYGLQFDGRIFIKHNTTASSTTTTSNSTKVTNKELKAVDAPMVLKDKDIKKINNLDPYTMVAEFRVRDANGNMNVTVRYIIGVKTILHPVRTQDLVEELPELVTGKVKGLQKVRYKTGEITLMDYLLNPKGLKKDASKSLNPNKKWINTLKRLSDYKTTYASYLKKPITAISGGSVPIPNGTLILSQADVTSITNETGIDLSVASNCKRLADNLFLIAVGIVDSSAGTIKILFPDRSSSWDIQSLAAIDAEVSKTDNSELMKELNKVINK